jgi:hypothetical protein
MLIGLHIGLGRLSLAWALACLSKTCILDRPWRLVEPPTWLINDPTISISPLSLFPSPSPSPSPTVSHLANNKTNLKDNI